MTEDDRTDELAAESIEDLEAPAAALGDVAGGQDQCVTPTCLGHTKAVVYCLPGTCQGTGMDCSRNTGTVILYNS